MMIRILPNGNLEMTANSACRKRITQLKKFFGGATYGAEAGFLADELKARVSPRVYEQTAPCSVGALTEAAIITNGDDCWGYMDYQITSFLDELEAGRPTIWQKG